MGRTSRRTPGSALSARQPCSRYTRITARHIYVLCAQNYTCFMKHLAVEHKLVQAFLQRDTGGLGDPAEADQPLTQNGISLVECPVTEGDSWAKTEASDIAAILQPINTAPESGPAARGPVSSTNIRAVLDFSDSEAEI